MIHFKGGASINVDKALVSVGRKLNSKGLALEKAGLKEGPKGAIEVNEKMETHVPWNLCDW